MAPLAFAAVIFASCSGSGSNSAEQTEITTMDSTNQAVKDSTDKLEDQTKKLEASLEKLDSDTGSTK